MLAASVLGLAGVTMFYFRVPFADFYVLSPDLGFLVTVIWVVVVANAVNLIDGLDGLAAGVVAIAAGAFFVYAYRLSEVGLLAPDNMAPMVVAITCGLCVGFLPHNFHPAKVFMGDSGAMLLGLLLAATTISVGGRTADQFSGQTFFFFAPLVIPFVILGVPFVDTALAIVRRARRRTALSLADKEHLHHKLMNQGHGPRRSSSSCGPGRRSWPAWCSCPPTPTRATRSCPSPSSAWPWCSTRCSTPASARPSSRWRPRSTACGCRAEPPRSSGQRRSPGRRSYRFCAIDSPG